MDTGIHAGMTAFLARLNLCIKTSAERGNNQNVARMERSGMRGVAAKFSQIALRFIRATLARRFSDCYGQTYHQNGC